jgi:hypothetical protein
MPYEELDAAARMFEQLVAHPAWGVLLDLLDKERALVDAKLDNGDDPLEQAQYSLLHGKRYGLQAPRMLVEGVLARHSQRRDRLKSQVLAGSSAGGA